MTTERGDGGRAHQARTPASRPCRGRDPAPVGRVDLPGSTPTGEEGDAPDHLDDGIREVRRQHGAQAVEVVRGVGEDAAGVVVGHHPTGHPAPGHAVVEQRRPEHHASGLDERPEVVEDHALGLDGPGQAVQQVAQAHRGEGWDLPREWREHIGPVDLGAVAGDATGRDVEAALVEVHQPDPGRRCREAAAVEEVAGPHPDVEVGVGHVGVVVRQDAVGRAAPGDAGEPPEDGEVVEREGASGVEGVASLDLSGRRHRPPRPAAAGHLGGQLGAAGQVDLAEDVGEVGLDGPSRDVEPGADLGVGEPLGHQRGDLDLHRRQRVPPGLRARRPPPGAPRPEGAERWRRPGRSRPCAPRSSVEGSAASRSRATACSRSPVAATTPAASSQHAARGRAAEGSER